MKKVIMMMALIMCFVSIKAQVNLPLNENGKAVFTKVTEIDSTSADVLFNRAKLFTSDNFNSSKSVIDYSTDNSIIIKANLPAYFFSYNKKRPCGYFEFTLKIYCKDNRYKYELSNLTHYGDGVNEGSDGGNIENEKPLCGTMLMTLNQWNYIRNDVIEQVNALLTQLKNSMKQQSDIETKW